MEDALISDVKIKSIYRDLPTYEEQETYLHSSLETLIQKEMSK